MELEKYRPYWTKDYLMGPNSLRVLQELLEKNPCPLNADSLILDLGCGTGLTSFALCMETGAKVLANDLWISGEENAARFAAWGVGDRITPVHENADNLRFAPESFDAVVSIDSYHYFAGKEGYFREKILGEDPDMVSAEVFELDYFEAAWQDWLAMDNPFTKDDAACWEQIIKPYTNFVGMIIRKK